MVNFVLVAGAWLGAWAWDEVAPGLRAAGHGAYPLTLPGLAERRGEEAGARDHVAAIVAEIEARDLREVVLVGHSYSGIPVGQAAQRIGDRLARVVFVDSGVPVDGESFASAWSDEGRAILAESFRENDGFWAPLTAEDCEGQGLTDGQAERLVRGATPHPGATLTEPALLAVPLGDLPATYVKCLLDGPEPDAVVAGLLKGESWRLVEMDTGHWPMFSEPRALAAVLIREVSSPADGARPATSTGPTALDPHGRPQAPVAGDEAATLLGFLDFQRATLAWKCAGLDKAGLAATVGASSMTLGGILKHLAYVEDNWFSVSLHGADPAPEWAGADWAGDRDWEWHSAAGDTPERLRALWQDSVTRSRALVSGALAEGGLDRTARRAWPDGRTPGLRWIVVHMIEEYARHNGHADLLREVVDGETGE